MSLYVGLNTTAGATPTVSVTTLPARTNSSISGAPSYNWVSTVSATNDTYWSPGSRTYYVNTLARYSAGGINSTVTNLYVYNGS